jgi:hypothetical protein
MRSHLFASALIGLAFAGACATGKELAPDEASLAQEACEAQCDCLKCNDAQQDKCEEDMELLVDEAEGKNCDDELDEYMDCIGDDAECQGAQLDTAMCGGLAAGFSACMASAPATCATVGDGVCDEPEGTGKCVDGTDIADCAGNSFCPTVNNGVCDEPGGTGLCPPLSDLVDCSGGTCAYVNDGYCDEPEGSGVCAEGTDPIDCATAACDYTNDGYCDEPEGSGICPEGSDVADCGGSGSCSTCYEYGYEASPLPLCADSVGLWDAVANCICSYGCATECASLCTGGSTDSYCDSCQNTTCLYELEACFNDI